LNTSDRRAALARGAAMAAGVAVLSLTTVWPPRVAAAQTAFDHGHAAFDRLLAAHVAWRADGHASAVDYAGFARERAGLQAVLASYSAVSGVEYDRFSRDQRLAFLINAYNAFTIELILTRYPDLKSIKDLGSLFQSPWKKKFFRLLGEERTLDWIEHDMIRKPGAFDEPRIHFVVNCASIGCPALRPEAVTAARLDAQLQDSTRRFVGDPTRNRFDAGSGKLQVSKIFDWYGGDFAKGHRGIASLSQFFASHADLLATDPAARERIRQSAPPIEFLDYDWALNKR
jgi:Protein of unknown function, DUF547